jgi:hypothetical protein
MDMLAYFGLIFAAIFIPLGLFMLSGRGKYLIAGYNTMNAEERAKADAIHDMDKMSKMLGILLIIVGVAAGVCFSGYVDPMAGTIIFLLAIFIPLAIVIIGTFTFLRKDR